MSINNKLVPFFPGASFVLHSLANPSHLPSTLFPESHAFPHTKFRLRITTNKDLSLHAPTNSKKVEPTDLGPELGIEVVLIEGGVEIVEREGDAIHGSSAAPLVGVLEELLELGPLPGLGIVDGHGGDDGQRRRPRASLRERSEGVGEAVARERRASQARELLRQRSHLFRPPGSVVRERIG